MNKTITIRKNKGHRICIRLFFFVLVAISFVVCRQTSGLAFWLLFFPVQLPAFILLVYYETWSISLTAHEIKLRCFIFWERSYRNCKIKDIYIAYSYTLHEYICIVFSDGKRVTVQTQDENANVAKRILKSYHSIRVSKWK